MGVRSWVETWMQGVAASAWLPGPRALFLLLWEPSPRGLQQCRGP